MAKRLRRERYPLLLIEWEDSCTSYGSWTPIADIPRNRPPVLIATVGWLLRRRKRSITVVQNVGGLKGHGRAQVCNAMTIPTGCIIRETVLKQ